MQQQNIKIEIVEITPVLASEFLAKNKNFRALNERRAEHFADQIKLGRWQLNGESIKFDEAGNLIDGQHRLRGIVLASHPIQSVVVRGVDDKNVDTGAVRTMAQLLTSKGHPYGSQLSSTGNFVFRFENFGSFQTSDYVSRDDVLQTIEKYPRLWEAIQFTNKTSHLFGRWSLHAAVYFMLATLCDVDEATRFYQSLIDGMELSANNPVYHLREKLLANKFADAKLSTNPTAGLVIKAWNVWMTKGAAKQLRYNFQREGLPEIITEKVRQDNGLKFKGDE